MALEVVKCVGSTICVPAAAEIVIEGRIAANARAMEGPFGEFPQYYGERAERHVIKVDRVTHRQNPIFTRLSAVVWSTFCSVPFLASRRSSRPYNGTSIA